MVLTEDSLLWGHPTVDELVILQNAAEMGRRQRSGGGEIPGHLDMSLLAL